MSKQARRCPWLDMRPTFELIQKEAQGEQVGGSMILVHAEDQLMERGRL